MEERYEEKWRQIPGYEGWYDVSNLGRVMRMKKVNNTFAGRIIKPYVNFGYNIVALHKNGNVKNNRVHRLVMAAFVGPCPKDIQVNHIDGDKSNNCLENLEYATQSENTTHAYALGLQSQQGEKNNSSKLTEEDVHEIRKLFGEETQKEIAFMFGVSKAAINNIAVGKTWGWLK